MLSRDDFIGVVMGELSQIYDVRMEMVEKPGLTYEAFVISAKGTKDNQTVGSLFNVDEYFEFYQQGHDIEDTVSHICEIYEDSSIRQSIVKNVVSDLSEDNSFFAQNIRERLIAYEGNEHYLEDKPYTPYLDMAIVYEVRIAAIPATFMINNQIMESFHLTKDDVVDFAKENRKSVNYEIGTMKDYFIERIIEEENITNPFEQMMLKSMIEAEWGDRPEMYIVTNKYKMHGASAMLDDVTMKKVGNIMKSDFLILPSSQHEIIVIPDQGNRYEELCQMVSDINRDHVGPSDVLTNSIYHYSRKEQKVTLKETIPTLDLEQEMNFNVKHK